MKTHWILYWLTADDVAISITSTFYGTSEAVNREGMRTVEEQDIPFFRSQRAGPPPTITGFAAVPAREARNAWGSWRITDKMNREAIKLTAEQMGEVA